MDVPVLCFGVKNIAIAHEGGSGGACCPSPSICSTACTSPANLPRALQASGKTLVALEGPNLVDGVWGAARPAAPSVSAEVGKMSVATLGSCRRGWTQQPPA